MAPQPETTLIVIQQHLDLLTSATGDERQRHLNDLFQFAYHRLHSRAEMMLRNFPRLRDTPGDIVHDAYLALTGVFADLEKSPAITTAMHYIKFVTLKMRRHLLDLARRIQLMPGQLESGFEQSQSTWNPVTLANWTQFHEVVESLPENERECFDFKWYMGLTNTEIAKLLQVKEWTVRRLLDRAQERIEEGCGGKLPWEP